MTELRQILEKYLRTNFPDKPDLSISHLDKLRDGWESDNYLCTVEYGNNPMISEDWVWRIYSGTGSQAKAAREFAAMDILHSSGYPVPQVLLLETENFPVDRPFIIMEYIQSEMMWELLDTSSQGRQEELIDQFCRLFVQLHALDWKLFDYTLPVNDPYLFINRLLDDIRRGLQNNPGIDISPFFDWVASHLELYACTNPAPSHRDFHPGNILVRASAVVIDWTNFAVTDPRFDLAWTLVLAYAHGRPGLRDEIFQCYQRHAGKKVEQIETFEAFACAQRLVHLSVSLTQGAQQMGMNAQATDAILASMEAHKKVHCLFVERTGLHIKALEKLFGGLIE